MSEHAPASGPSTIEELARWVLAQRTEDIPQLAIAFRHSRVLSRPVVVGFSREMLRGEA